MGRPLGSIPHFVQKTDQPRLQSLKQSEIFDLFKYDFEVTEKLDGTSASFYCFSYVVSMSADETNEYANYRFGVCSRNLEIKESGIETIEYKRQLDPDEEALVSDWLDEQGNRFRNETKQVELQSIYWDMAKKYHIRERLLAYCLANHRLLAIQGEICGVGIQKNPCKLPDVQFFVFDIFDIATQRYLAASQRNAIIAEMNKIHSDDNPIQQVPFVGWQTIAPDSNQISLAAQTQSEEWRSRNTAEQQDRGAWQMFIEAVAGLVLKDLILQADGQGHFAKTREGLVFKSLQNPMVSFKVISNNYLLKNEE